MNCDTLRELLENERYTNKQLLDRLLYVPEEKPEPATRPVQVNTKKFTSWAIRREMLEKADRETALEARIAKEAEVKQVPVADLERELLSNG